MRPLRAYLAVRTHTGGTNQGVFLAVVGLYGQSRGSEWGWPLRVQGLISPPFFAVRTVMHIPSTH